MRTWGQPKLVDIFFWTLWLSNNCIIDSGLTVSLVKSFFFFALIYYIFQPLLQTTYQTAPSNERSRLICTRATPSQQPCSSAFSPMPRSLKLSSWVNQGLYHWRDTRSCELESPVLGALKVYVIERTNHPFDNSLRKIFLLCKAYAPITLS